MGKSQIPNTNNAFIKLQESANGRVSVKLQKNNFAKTGTENYFGKVERFTYSTKNILDAMAEAVPLVDVGTITSVMNAYANTVLKVLASGNAVKFGELGTFYIAGKGTVDNVTGKPSLTVKFSAAPALKEIVHNIEIASSEYVEPSGVITGVTDVTTGKTDGTISSGSSVLIEGSGIKVGGEGSGIWFVPVKEDNELEGDKSLWIKIESVLVYNLPSKLLFSLPENVTNGKYKILVSTRYAGKGGYKRKYLMETISETVEVV